MTTKVYCFSGWFHQFYGVEPEAFLAEVDRQFDGAEVRGIHPAYRLWGAEPGAHGSEVDALAEELTNDCAGANRIVMIGFSIGGYLAVLLGNLLPATHVLAYAPPTNLRSVNIGFKRRPEKFDDRYFDLLPYCQGAPKMHLIADESQRGKKNSHNPIQVQRLGAVPNLEIGRHRKFDFKGDYFPGGGFANDLRNLVS